jgi:hypothetical protein
MIGKNLFWAFLLVAVLAKFAAGNTVRGAEQCRVERFDRFVRGFGDIPFRLIEYRGVLDLTDFATFNIVAAVTDGCKPKCVKLSLAGDEGKERGSPFALYGDVGGKLRLAAPSRSGLQELKACLYADRSCTIGEYGCLSEEVDIIPVDEPLLAGPFTFTFLVVINGVENCALSEEEFIRVAGAGLCSVVDEHFSGIGGAFFSTDLARTDFMCSAKADIAATTFQLDIEFGVRKGFDDDAFINRRLPDRDELFQKMTTVLQDNNEIGPIGPGSRDYFVAYVGPFNPYSAVTSFTVIV